jgi:DHA1 family tetracycline resistance protein-like MFS transporter
VTFAVESHEQGAAAGLTSSITGLGFIIGPSLGTGLYGLKPMYPYLFAALVLAAGIVTLVTMVPRLRISE